MFNSPTLAKYGLGRISNVDLARLPVARIPHTSERSRTRLWLKEQGIRKLVSIVS